MHAHLLVLLDLDVHLGGRVREGAAPVGLPEEVRLAHLQQQQRFSKLTPREYLREHCSNSTSMPTHHALVNGFAVKELGPYPAHLLNRLCIRSMR